MRLSKWFKGKKSDFEARLLIDNPDIKVVAASYKGNPFFVGVGISKQREIKGSGQAGLMEGLKGEYQSQKDLEWQLFYNVSALPPGFVPSEKLKDLMVSTVALTSGSITVYNSSTTGFEETNPEELRKLVNLTKLGEVNLRSFFETRRKKKGK